jgi:hypothetical protein
MQVFVHLQPEDSEVLVVVAVAVRCPIDYSDHRVAVLERRGVGRLVVS